MYDVPGGAIDSQTVLSFSWFQPSCQECEASGGACRLKDSQTRSNLNIECLKKHKPNSGSSKKLVVAGKRPFNSAALLDWTKWRENINERLKNFWTIIKEINPQDIPMLTGLWNCGQGELSNDVSVAVKILDSSESDGDEFINEVATMGRIHHVNVVRLAGFCADGFRRALIYEFLPNGSLEKIIYSRNDFNPKISDFGQAKLCFRDKSHVSMTAARGTMGYMAPEVFSRNFGNVSYKSDVYSFGMLLLELHFPAWIYDSLEGKDDKPSQIDDDEQAKIVKKLTTVGLRCIQWYPVDRPSMNVVVQMLEGEEDNLTIPPNPFASTCPSSSSTGSIPRRPFNQELPAIPESE
ncbi:Serine-threonine/tyrosine-protein kinase, catalytic domain [Dillenia turbinata]|uniref:Serine-threonine/tyrosine-protein kinase, catalytic domain n=1 Tax=Dillenia turbinata TaxID=194707 RepID=A0AAN8V6S0_9MAGN